MTQWDSPPEETTNTPPPSSEAITTPVTRMVVDETESFFSAFLAPGDLQDVNNTQVVSVPPTKSHRRPQETEKKSRDVATNNDLEPHNPCSTDTVTQDHQEAAKSQSLQSESSTVVGSPPDTIFLQPISLVSSQSDHPCDAVSKTTDESMGEIDVTPTVPEDAEMEQSLTPSEPQEVQVVTDSSEPPAVTSEPKSSTPSDPSPPPKEILLEPKDLKTEDRQSDTPSPPVSAFSSGTSTTSDIEVLDHESVQSESSASSRQETGEGKAGLHLMQGSFQLLSASTCGDFTRLEDYPKLTESCGSSSDAFERIDSFSVQSLDSRSVSEVNSDDETPGSRTLASVTAGPTPANVESSTVAQNQEAETIEAEGEEDEEEEGLTEAMRDQSLDEMEESGRSATPVNSEQPEELMEQEQESEVHVTVSGPTPDVEEQLTPPITEEMKSVSTCQILELQKVTAGVDFQVADGHNKDFVILPFQLRWHFHEKHYSRKMNVVSCLMSTRCFQFSHLAYSIEMFVSCGLLAGD